MRTSWLKYVTLGGLFLVPLTVLIVANSLFFPFITGKVFFYRIIVEIIFGAWLLLALRSNEFRPHVQKIYYVLAGLVGVLLLSNILSAFPYKAFWSNFERMDGWITLFHHVLFFIVISSVLKTYDLWKRFFGVSLVVSLVVCFYGFLQFIGVLDAIQGGARIDGTFGNAAYLAVYNLFHVFLAFWFLYNASSKSLKWLYGVVGLCNLFNLYGTATRGALLGLVVGFLVSALLVVITQKDNMRARKIAGGLIVVVLVVISSVFLFKDSQLISQSATLSRFANTTLSSGSARFQVWGMALEGIKEKPIVGWGQEGFNTVFARYYTPEMYAQEPWFDRVHNIVLDWMIAGGLIGFLLYGSVLYFGFVYLWRSEWLNAFEKSIFTGLYVSYIIQNLFVFDNVASYILFFATLAFFTVGARRDEKVFLEGKTLSHAFMMPVRVVVVLGVVVSVYLVNLKPISAGQDLIRALTPGTTPEMIVSLYQDSLDKNTFASREIAEQMMSRAPGFISATDVDNDTKQAYVTTAARTADELLKQQPDNVRLLYATGVFFGRIGDIEKSIEILERAHVLSPQKQLISFELAFAYLTRGDIEQGLDLLEKTYEDAPEFLEARKMYALGAIIAGDAGLEQKLLQGLPDDFFYTDNRVIQVLARMGRNEELLAIWQWRVDDEPTNIQNYVSLAAVYNELGQKDQAVLILRRAIEIEPRFEEQGEIFIDRVQNGS